MAKPIPSLLLVDDDVALLEALAQDLEKRLSDIAVDVRRWVPSGADNNPMEKLAELADDSTVLIVTDWDLTTQGQTGFFGPTVVGWSQQRAIPVGDFSRKTVDALPKDPNFFELRVPNDNRAAAFIEQAFRGFHTIGSAVLDHPETFLPLRSPAAVLATVLGRPEVESQLTLYSPQLGSASGALLNRVLATAPETIEPDKLEKLRLLAYVSGHVLFNAVLKYPGPILDRQSLCSYFGAANGATDKLAEVFASARYTGPFAGNDDYFWRDAIDDRLDELAGDATVEGETVGEVNRAIVENAIGETLPRHDCKRCAGQNGGFHCPFTQRPVCIRGDCSIGSSSWIPDGARVCRVEYDFYEEWAPLLGL